MFFTKKSFLFLVTCIFCLPEIFSCPKSEQIYGNLSETEAVCQLFLVNVEGNSEYTPVESDENGNPVVPGGVLLFSYNIADSEEKVGKFTGSIDSYCKKRGILSPYVAVDQEGGYVDRLRNISMTMPSQKSVAAKSSPGQACDSLYTKYASAMKRMGIHMNLAPVAEVSSSYNSEFLGSRSFGGLPETIAYSAAAVGAYESHGVGAVIKHFPGNNNTDPHTGLPELHLSEDEIYSNVILPYMMLVCMSPSGILMSHCRMWDFGEENPVPSTFSSFWTGRVLRDRFGYTGLIISDDIFMAALGKNGYSPDDAAVRALDAGCDVIMLSEKKFYETAKLIRSECRKNPVFAEKVRKSVMRVIDFKIEKGILE